MYPSLYLVRHSFIMVHVYPSLYLVRHSFILVHVYPSLYLVRPSFMQLGELRQGAMNETAPASKRFCRLSDVLTTTLRPVTCQVYL